MLTQNEWSQYNNKLNEELKNKSNKNLKGETIISVGEHSSDITALVYVKGTAGNPVITKVVRVNEGIKEQYNISVILEELNDYDRQGYRKANEYVEGIYGQKIFNVYTSDNFKNFQELQREQKRGVSRKDNANNQSKQDRTRGIEENSRVSEAGLNNSAFSIDIKNKKPTYLGWLFWQRNRERVLCTLIARRPKSAILVPSSRSSLKTVHRTVFLTLKTLTGFESLI